MRTLRRFLRRPDGSVAVESIFVIPVFFTMVCSLIEIGAVFYRTSMIDLAANDMARVVLTGQAPAKGVAGAIAGVCDAGNECFFDQVCERVSVFGDCDEKLSVEVASFDTIGELVSYTSTLECPNAPGYTQAGQPYDPGDRLTYTYVRVCFLIDILNPIVGASFATNPDGTRSIVSVAIRRNEPYLRRNQLNPNVVPGS